MFDLYGGSSTGFLSHEQVFVLLTETYGFQLHQKHIEIDPLASP